MMVIIMKVYFIFDVKDEFIKLYTGNERVLYSILKHIYFLEKEEIAFGYNLFSQLTNVIDKNEIDRKIFLKFHQDVPYSKKGQIHYINNLYKDEISRLIIRKSYIRLESEQKFSTFFSILKNFSNNFFVCNFEETDYFFLTKDENNSRLSIQT